MPIGFSGGWRVRKSVWGCHFVETPCSIARVISSTSFFPRGYKVPKTSPAAAHRISGSMMEQKMMPPSTLCGCCAAPPINPVAANIYPGIAPATPWAALETKEDRDATVNCTPFVRQYGILSNKWGVFLCQKEYQTNDIRRNSKNW